MKDKIELKPLLPDCIKVGYELRESLVVFALMRGAAVPQESDECRLFDPTPEGFAAFLQSCGELGVYDQGHLTYLRVTGGEVRYYLDKGSRGYMGGRYDTLYVVYNNRVEDEKDFAQLDRLDPNEFPIDDTWFQLSQLVTKSKFITTLRRPASVRLGQPA